MKIKTAELAGAALDRVVAECEGRQVFDSKDALRNHLNSLDQDELWNALCANTPADIDASISSVQEMITYGVDNWRYPAYSTDWVLGGSIIEKQEIDTYCCQSAKTGSKLWIAEITGTKAKGRGPTALIAAMRCRVASKLGDEVEVPEEIV